MENINPHYENFSASSYVSNINTPARDQTYFDTFHAPLLTEAVELSGNHVVLLDIACGFSLELDFIANNPRLTVVGVDIERNSMAAAKKRLPTVNFVVADVEHSPISDDFADVAIAVNAMVYKPYFMLRAMMKAMKEGAKGAANFRVFSNVQNRPFYEYYLNLNCAIYDQELKVGEKQYNLKVLDYRNSTDPTFIGLDRQLYFESTEDIERLISAAGLGIVDHQTYRFKSPANPENEIDVYTFVKRTTLPTL